MNCFQLIKSVLDKAYESIPGDESAKDASILAKLEHLSTQYGQLLSEGCLDYSDPATRFAYIYRYTTAHANMVSCLIERCPGVRSLFDNKKVVLSCIGGGPGSDFVGVLKYCLQYGKSPTLKCHIMDRDPAWGESWSDVDDKVGTDLRISNVFYPLDVTKPSDVQTYSKHYEADLFTMVYFLSEVYARRFEAVNYFRTLFARARSGSRFLFIDNRSQPFFGWFDQLAKEAKLEVEITDETRFVTSSDEEKRDLGVYFNKFPNPKVQAEVAQRPTFRRMPSRRPAAVRPGYTSILNSYRSMPYDVMSRPSSRSMSLTCAGSVS